jgi:hypothetical protein
MTPRVSCRLSATGIRFLGILFPPGASALLTVGLPGCAWTPAGFPRSAHPSHDRIGCPLYPEATRCSHGRSDPSGRRSPPLPGARPYRPGLHPIARGCLLRGVIEGSLAFTRPAFPLACNPRMERGLLGLDPRASHPSRQDLRRTPGRETGIEHSPGATRPALPDLQSVHSLAMVRSARGALPVLPPVGFPESPPAPGVRLSAHRALRKPRRVLALTLMLCSATVPRSLFPGSSSAWRLPWPGRTTPRPRVQARCRSVGVVVSMRFAGACAPAI